MRRLSSTSSSSSEGKKADALEEMNAHKEEAMMGANESKEDRRSRMRSLYIVHSGMFIFMLGYSIIITGVFPYMKQVRNCKRNEP